jgi:hypothetical protein
MKKHLLAFFLLFSSSAYAETGYVFEGDLNGDGIPDSIMSGPSKLFGNAGGPFIVSLSDGKGHFIRKETALNPDLTAFDPAEGHPRIWGYWHVSSSEGVLSATTLDEAFETKTINLYGDNPESDTSMSAAIFNAVFNKKTIMKFRKVKNYKLPPPLASEWGK